MENCLIYLYYNGKIIESEEGVTFVAKNYLSFYVKQFIDFNIFRAEIVSRISAETGRSISYITYRFPISVMHGKAQFRAYLLRDDNDMQLLFDCYRRYYPDISAAEVIVDFVDEASGSGEPSEQRLVANDLALGDYGDSDEEDDPDFQCSEEEEEAEDDHEYRYDAASAALDEDDLPADMYHLDLESMNLTEFPQLTTQGHFPSSGAEELEVGMHFESKEAVQDTVKDYSVRKFVDYKVKKSNTTTYLVQCQMYGEGCNWRLLASFSQRRGLWQISRYNGPHTCTAREFTLDHRRLDSSFISRCILPLVKQNSSLSIAVLQAEIKARFKHEPSYRKTWIAKQKAIEALFGSWETSFAELPVWLNAMQHFVPGSVFRLQNDVFHEENGQIDPSRKVFRRVFWSFGPCIEAFKFCKRIVQIDGTHLYGKYRGTLLVAVSQDGNRNIVPLAFAIVEGETFEAWEFFLHNLRTYVTPQDGHMTTNLVECVNSVLKRARYLPTLNIYL